MRRALATASVAGVLALAPFATAPAFADVAVAGPVLTSNQGTDTDEPLTQDGNDDTGKYGLIGLTGMLGLFGYKKYRDHQAASRTAGTTGTTGPDGSQRRA